MPTATSPPPPASTAAPPPCASTARANQLLTGSATTTVGALPNLVIDKRGGTLTLAGTIRTLRDWTYLGGLLNPGTSSVVFSGTQTISGSHSLAGVDLRNALVRTLAAGTTLTVTGLLRLTDGELNGGDSLDAHGDITAASAFDGGTATLRINGARQPAADRQRHHHRRCAAQPGHRQDRGGTLTLAGTIRTLRDWTYLGGLLNPGTSSVVFSGTQTISRQPQPGRCRPAQRAGQDPGRRHHADRHRPAAADRRRAQRR